MLRRRKENAIGSFLSNINALIVLAQIPFNCLHRLQIFYLRKMTLELR